MKRGSTKKLSKFPKKFKVRPTIAIPSFIFGSILAAALTVAGYQFYYWGKIYPGVRIAGVNVGGLTIEQAEKQLSEQIKTPEKLTLRSKDQNFDVTLSDTQFSYDYKSSAQKAFYLYKTSAKISDLKKSLLTSKDKPNLNLEYTINQEKLDEYLSVIAGQVAVEPVYPEVKLVNSKINIERGKAGVDVDKNLLAKNIRTPLLTASFQPVEIPLLTIDPTLTDEEVESISHRAENFKTKSVTLNFEYLSFTYKDNDLASLIDIQDFSQTRVDVLIDKLTPKVERNPQNAVFRFEDNQVKEFLAAKEGVKVNKEVLKNQFIDALNELETTDSKNVAIKIPTTNTPPTVTTKEVNSLGINELVGRGESKFAGSISSRVHNVALAASKFNGVLINPGETLSFNDVLGDVSALTGYKQAYVIKDGKTVLGDGGGVCQVSTTFFRAALNAGLPIIERRAHSYRVGYYEQGSSVGLDATVYAPTTDLKIKNDTPNHILIQTTTDTKNMTLVFELYGTSDGRVATITKPVVTGVIAPPEDLYVDDPTLPTGTVKQIDWKAWGAKASFNYKVIRGGETLQDRTFVSNYRPWQAVFLKGTGQVN